MAEEKTEDFSKLSFREAMQKLTETVNTLESGNLELEESLETYKSGVALIADIRARLDKAQQTVEDLRGNLEEGATDEEVDSNISS